MNAPPKKDVQTLSRRRARPPDTGGYYSQKFGTKLFVILHSGSIIALPHLTTFAVHILSV
jgi:hypothetical protein